MSIEGIPDGWELVRIGEIQHGEFFIHSDGSILQHDENQTVRMNKNYVIIRKKPKRYRPFAKLIDAQPLVGEVLRFKVDHRSMALFIGITSSGFQIGLSHWKPKEAFDFFERLDGTPFGIEVTE